MFHWISCRSTMSNFSSVPLCIELLGRGVDKHAQRKKKNIHSNDKFENTYSIICHMCCKHSAHSSMLRMNMEKAVSASFFLCLSPWCWNIQTHTHTFSPLCFLFFPPWCWNRVCPVAALIVLSAYKCTFTSYLVARHMCVTSEKD